ncbi:MAG: hypothetical protein QOJ00_1487 [Actinomycetota bacterium]
MIRLDAATVLLQWSVGGLAFLWVTTRGRLLGIGYGWLMRAIFIAFALGSIAAGLALDTVPVRELASAGVVLASTTALVVSIMRRKAGVSGGREIASARHERVAAMLDNEHPAPQQTTVDAPLVGAEFPPVLDAIAPVVGVVGLIAAGWADARSGGAGTHLLSVARIVVGAAFLGSVTDAMLLGHWYLVQPGLPRAPLFELNNWVARIWPFEVALLLIPTGMFSVFSGSIDDGYGGMLGWFWIACAVTTIVLCFVTNAALKERSYSAVMAATGLLYLAILTAFGTDLVARAVLAS